ncbi:hypothetical protein JAAARDRAFT_197550 [Jaapia argillacea MUCL 33604]|uniref:HCP-like protein n=1 Tax=Jaapia argillacea MUCL 33604 TaxID=933084 RepID=A0A067PSV4_9AGAM|nr:hypothetical protein JAAARDRAFT_197550 [Jaapia argillacea MUCL 33604]
MRMIVKRFTCKGTTVRVEGAIRSRGSIAAPGLTPSLAAPGSDSQIVTSRDIMARPVGSQTSMSSLSPAHQLPVSLMPNQTNTQETVTPSLPPSPIQVFITLNFDVPYHSMNLSPPPAAIPLASDQSNYSAPQPVYPSSHQPSYLSSQMAGLTFTHASTPRSATSIPTYRPAARPQGAPSLTAPLPTVPLLASSFSTLQGGQDVAAMVTWCRDVLSIVDHSQLSTLTDPTQGAVQITDPDLQRLIDITVPLLLQIASPAQMLAPTPRYIAEAIYLKATIASSGVCPQYLPRNPRSAFKDFVKSARKGYSAAYFNMGRDYEDFNKVALATDCYDPTLATVEVPQRAYVYALLLLNEFSPIIIPPNLFATFLPPNTTQNQEARDHLERTAYLNFAPAQYKLGYTYEYAQPPFPFNPLLSIRYYALASEQGECEADIALSKWFLCSAEGCFDKDEGLALTFAERAASKGLVSAEFALGYYAELGIGRPKDIEVTRNWYSTAAEHGSTDALERLPALSQQLPQAFSRQEHDAIIVMSALALA